MNVEASRRSAGGALAVLTNPLLSVLGLLVVSFAVPIALHSTIGVQTIFLLWCSAIVLVTLSMAATTRHITYVPRSVLGVEFAKALGVLRSGLSFFLVAVIGGLSAFAVRQDFEVGSHSSQLLELFALVLGTVGFAVSVLVILRSSVSLLRSTPRRRAAAVTRLGVVILRWLDSGDLRAVVAHPYFRRWRLLLASWIVPLLAPLAGLFLVSAVADALLASGV